jgi:hypothetical protein
MVDSPDFTSMRLVSRGGRHPGRGPIGAGPAQTSGPWVSGLACTTVRRREPRARGCRVLHRVAGADLRPVGCIARNSAQPGAGGSPSWRWGGADARGGMHTAASAGTIHRCIEGRLCHQTDTLSHRTVSNCGQRRIYNLPGKSDPLTKSIDKFGNNTLNHEYRYLRSNPRFHATRRVFGRPHGGPAAGRSGRVNPAEFASPPATSLRNISEDRRAGRAP